MKKQIIWADNLKALGILLIVWGHFLDNCLTKHIIYSFHVPLFFFISGYFFKPKESTLWGKSSNIKGIIKSVKQRMSSILIPYWIYVVLLFPVSLYISRRDFPVSFVKDLTFITGSMSWNSPLWFLPCLFITWLFCYLFINGRTNTLILSIVAFVSIFVSCIAPRIPNDFRLFGLLRVFSVLPFFIFGFCFKKNDVINKINQRVKLYYPLIVTAGFFWVLFGIILNPKITIYEYVYNNYIFLVIGAMAAIIALALLFSRFERESALTRISNYTVFIMSTHMLIVIAYRRLLQPYLVQNRPLLVCATFAMAILVVLTESLICKLICNKFQKLSSLLGIRQRA